MKFRPSWSHLFMIRLREMTLTMDNGRCEFFIPDWITNLPREYTPHFEDAQENAPAEKAGAFCFASVVPG
jgi:hypothetical protein